MSHFIEPEGDAVRKALRWIGEQRKDRPGLHLADLVSEAGKRFDLTPMEQESITAILTLGPAPA